MICCDDMLCYTTLHYTTLHYTTLHYTTLHYTTLHYIYVSTNIHIPACTLFHVQLMESFGAGTAAVICPVKGIIYQGQVLCVEFQSSCLFVFLPSSSYLTPLIFFLFLFPILYSAPLPLCISLPFSPLLPS